MQPTLFYRLLRWKFVLALLVGSGVPWLALAQAGTEQRIALLIGNATYKTSPLTNPVNDVRLMEITLKDAGFQIIKAENASRRDMQRLIRDFGEKLKQSGGVGLFYFAGHGVQVRGNNYLIPVDADIRTEDEVAFDSVDAQSVLEKMETARNRINLLILDACRDNPFARNSRSAVAGLATMSAPSGSLVAYSTAPGSVASDGSGKNGLYTEQLARVMQQPGLPVEEVFKQVRSAVRRASNNQQTPWENTALEGQFYFRAPVQVAPAPSPLPAPMPEPAKATGPSPLQLEMAMWDSVKGSTNPGELQAYVNRHPNGLFADIAKARIAALQGAAAERAAFDKAASERAVNERAAAEAALKAASERAAAERTAAERSSAERLAAERAAQASQSAQTVAKPDPQAAELAFWDSIKVSSKPNEMQAYLDQFPNGMFASLARARLAEAQAIKPPPATVAVAVAAMPPAAQTGAKSLGDGVLMVRDTLTGKEQRIEVVPVLTDANGTRWSTGDDIAADGQVRAVRIGTLVAKLQSGSLWKLPLQANASGAAQVTFDGVLFPGKLDWKVTSRNGGKAQLEVRLDYTAGDSSSNIRMRRYGSWIAQFEDGIPLAVSYKVDIRGLAVSGGIDLLTGEIQKLAVK